MTEEYKKIAKSWYLTTSAGKLYRKISGQITTAYEVMLDKKYTGISLTKYVPSVDKDNATGSESARYWSLDQVYDGLEFTADDKFIDIGCGKGRVLAFMKRINFPGKLYGIELNPDVAEYANKWAKSKYDDIEIFAGDAFKLNYNEYTILSLCRPFYEELFVEFVEKLENELTHEVTVICYVDNYMLKHLKGRNGWNVIKEGCAFKKGPIAFSYYPASYSVLTYKPE